MTAHPDPYPSPFVGVAPVDAPGRDRPGPRPVPSLDADRSPTDLDPGSDPTSADAPVPAHLVPLPVPSLDDYGTLVVPDPEADAIRDGGEVAGDRHTSRPGRRNRRAAAAAAAVATAVLAVGLVASLFTSSASASHETLPTTSGPSSGNRGDDTQ